MLTREDAILSIEELRDRDKPRASLDNRYDSGPCTGIIALARVNYTSEAAATKLEKTCAQFRDY